MYIWMVLIWYHSLNCTFEEINIFWENKIVVYINKIAKYYNWCAKFYVFICNYLNFRYSDDIKYPSEWFKGGTTLQLYFWIILHIVKQILNFQVRQKDRETERQRGRETERETERQWDTRQRDKSERDRKTE